MAVMTLPVIRRKFIRCQFCAGGAPMNLPELGERPQPAPMEPITSMARLGLLPLDEREPGQEG